MLAASARRSHDFIKARLGLLQQLCGLEQQAAVEAFLHVHTCFNQSDERISKAVAGLQQMLAGSRWTAGQLVASHPALLGEPCLARLPAAQLPFHAAMPFDPLHPKPRLQLLTASRWGWRLLCRSQRGDLQQALP